MIVVVFFLSVCVYCYILSIAPAPKTKGRVLCFVYSLQSNAAAAVFFA